MIPNLTEGRCPTCGRRGTWTAPEIIRAAKRWKREFGESPNTRDWRKSTPDHPSDAIARRMFGSFNAMLEAAGLESRRTGGGHFVWTKDSIANRMLDFAFVNGRWPTSHDWHRNAQADNHPAPQTVKRHFGSWEAAKRHAGWRPSEEIALAEARRRAKLDRFNEARKEARTLRRNELDGANGAARPPSSGRPRPSSQRKKAAA